ncbi:porin [Thauera aromatica]|nr:porin [Thauera aromatica]MCK2128111.1 porin [Thauera aromatica]
MNKKLIALAMAGLFAAPVAIAQSNVTVYGIVDAYLAYAKAGDNKRIGVDSGGLYGSRLGFRGTEDLGNGLKAVFTLEYSITVDQNEGPGGGPLRARQQFVGLQGAFGQISLGRQYAPGYAIARYDAAGGVPFGPQALMAGAAGSTIVPASPARWDNSIAYRAPKFGNLSMSAIYSLGEKNQDQDRRTGDRWAVAADYANGPLAIGLIYQHGRQVVAVTAEDQKDFALGASYNFGAVSLFATYQTVDTGDTDKVWHVGGRVPVGPGGSYAFIAYGELDADNGDKSASAGVIGYRHALSKRTSLYTAYNAVDNESAQKSPNMMPSRVTTNLGDSVSGVFFGISHTF